MLLGFLSVAGLVVLLIVVGIVDRRRRRSESILAELMRDPALTDGTKDVLRRAFQWGGMKGGGL